MPYWLAAAVAVSLVPIEECQGDPDFVSVRAIFETAVKMRDVKLLADISSDHVAMDEEGFYEGKAKLVEMMNGDMGPDYWRAIEPVIEAGCLDGESFRIMPSLAKQLTADEEMVVAAENEPIRATPSATGKIEGYARWEVVTTNLGDSGPDYWHVELKSGRIGYVRSERIYSNYSPFAVFERHDGGWQLAALRLIAAD